MVISYLLEKQKAGRILFIVPNVSLVVQGSEDFQDYNWRNQANNKGTTNFIQAKKLDHVEM